jgi:S-adenosylmethionine:diacylglycerol 3-amino-3-carboxypropyl transferase
VQVEPGTEFTLKVISIRDKVSKLTQSLNLKDSFYLEFKFTKPNEQVEEAELKLKPFDYSKIKGYTITLKN